MTVINANFVKKKIFTDSYTMPEAIERMNFHIIESKFNSYNNLSNNDTQISF